MRFADTDNGSVRRFLVTWRNRSNGTTYQVGHLSWGADHVYRFAYADKAALVPGFRLFLGFPDADREYESSRLWALFALRVMDPRRPDYLRYLSWLGLVPSASLLDVLSRSAGERKGDSVQLVEVPAIAPSGDTQSTFLVRGARYATALHGSRQDVSSLEEGQQLLTVADVGNPANPAARLVVTPQGATLGWIPDALLGYVASLQPESSSLVLVRNNGVDSPWHLRFLATLIGKVQPVDTDQLSGVRPTAG